MRKCLFFISVCYINVVFSQVVNNNSLIQGVWQSEDNINNYLVFKDKYCYDIFSYKNGEVSISTYYFGFNDNCNITSRKELKSFGNQLLQIDAEKLNPDPRNFICQGFSLYNRGNSMRLEVWASNQFIKLKRIKTLSPIVQEALDAELKKTKQK